MRPVQLAAALALMITPHATSRKVIGIADRGGIRMFTGGYIGAIGLVKKAAYTELSKIQLRKNGMGVHCPPERSLCRLTVKSDRHDTVFVEIVQSVPTNL